MSLAVVSLLKRRYCGQRPCLPCCPKGLPSMKHHTQKKSTVYAMEANGQGWAVRDSQGGWVSRGLETVALYWNTVLEQELGKVEREGSSLFKTSRFQPLRLPGPDGACMDQQERGEEASPGWKSSDPQVRGVPPTCSCSFQKSSSTAHQTSPHGAAPRPGKCCPAQGRRYTLRQGKLSLDLYGHGAGGWWISDLAGPSLWS